MKYHESGAGDNQDNPWFEPYCLVFDTQEEDDILFSIHNIEDTPYCTQSTSNPYTLNNTIKFLIRHSIPFQIS